MWTGVQAMKQITLASAGFANQRGQVRISDRLPLFHRKLYPGPFDFSFGKFERFGSIENVQTTSQGQLTFGIGAGFGGEITTNLIDDIAKPAY